MWKCVVFIFLVAISCSTCQVNPFISQMSQDSNNDDISNLEKPSDVKFAFAKHFQDNMVLQRAPQRARIYGFSPNIGAKVIALMTVTAEEKHYYGTHVVEGPAPGVGAWTLTLDPINVTSPVSIDVISETGSLSLKNVLFGDVWLCSGQSNMEFTVSQMLNGAQEAYDAVDFPNIRLFTAMQAESKTPLYDLATIQENWSIPSSATLSSGAWKHFSAVCWLYGKHLYQSLGYPIGLVATDWGGTPVEAWSSPDALKTCNVSSNEARPSVGLDAGRDLGVGGPQDNSCLWNAMVNPFLGMTIYGAIWYQGESDSVNPVMRNRYNCTFPAMIDDWRLKFSQASQGETSHTFPFGFVQLSANRPDPGVVVGFPDIRWHQTADYGYVPNPRMPKTFMAVSMDLPDYSSAYGSIHPRDKEDVGTRLALSGLAVAYNQPGVFQGPFPAKGSLQPPSTMTLSYGDRWTLKIINKNGFELSCKPTSANESVHWYPAPIKEFNTTFVSFDSSACSPGSLYGIRYAWRESPCGFKNCAVYSATSSLPAPPFVALFTTGADGETCLKL